MKPALTVTWRSDPSSDERFVTAVACGLPSLQAAKDHSAVVDVTAVTVFAAVVIWTSVVRRCRPRRRRRSAPPAELQAALTSFGGTATWRGLPVDAQHGLAAFVEMAITPRGRRRRAGTVAANCAAGRQALDEWMRSNAGLRETGTYYGAPF
jgi:hypothetical protein